MSCPVFGGMRGSASERPYPREVGAVDLVRGMRVEVMGRAPEHSYTWSRHDGKGSAVSCASSDAAHAEPSVVCDCVPHWSMCVFCHLSVGNGPTLVFLSLYCTNCPTCATMRLFLSRPADVVRRVPYGALVFILPPALYRSEMLHRSGLRQAARGPCQALRTWFTSVIPRLSLLQSATLLSVKIRSSQTLCLSQNDRFS